MDEARWGRNQDLGGSARELQSSSSNPLRTCSPCKGRDRDLQAYPQRGQRELCQRRASLHPATHAGGDRGCGHGQRCRFGRTKAARSVTGCSQCLCRIPWVTGRGSGATSSGSFRRRQRSSTASQASEVSRASEAWHICPETVTIGVSFQFLEMVLTRPCSTCFQMATQ